MIYADENVWMPVVEGASAPRLDSDGGCRGRYPGR
jgi:hypothetical protein